MSDYFDYFDHCFKAKAKIIHYFLHRFVTIFVYYLLRCFRLDSSFTGWLSTARFTRCSHSVWVADRLSLMNLFVMLNQLLPTTVVATKKMIPPLICFFGYYNFAKFDWEYPDRSNRATDSWLQREIKGHFQSKMRFYSRSPCTIFRQKGPNRPGKTLFGNRRQLGHFYPK